ncbi:MAG: CHAD domain-containing protein [Actinobacteria bacterium]|nr:CHAD domain-containing protein [Actinomycetota bacterium]MBI3688590.1 CHAD domain-containing protein [Actinomycetota bacterium]
MADSARVPAPPAGGATVLPDAPAATLAATIAATIAADFTVEPDPARPFTRIWLDTFDRRLVRRGLTLTYTSIRRGHWLVLTDPDGTMTEAAAPDLGWPALLDALPDGPLRDRLAPLVGVRALLPLAEGRGRRWDLRVLDENDKTVVRLHAEGPVRLVGGGGELPAGVGLVPVRGYRVEAARVRGRLEHAGLLADPAGRAAAGYPPVAGADPVVGYRPDLPATAGVAGMLESFLGEVEHNVDGTVDDIDTEFLHDLRVAVRRSRSVVKLVGDVLPARLVARAATELRWLGDLTTPTRDLDVYLLDLPAATAELAAARPEDLDAFAGYLGRLRAAERRKLVRGLGSARLARFRRDYRAGLTAAREAALADGGSTTLLLGGLAADRVTRAYRRMVRLGDRITAGSPAEDLHTLRKRGKELRYLLELFAPLFDSVTLGDAVRELKALQDCLGRFQDGEVQQAAIQQFATDMVASGQAHAPTLLAMGELAAQRHRVQQEARAQFEQRYQRFVRPRVRRQFGRLTEVGAG